MQYSVSHFHGLECGEQVVVVVVVVVMPGIANGMNELWLLGE